MDIGRDAAHVVVNGRQHWNRLLSHIYAGENLCGFRNTRQLLMQHLGTQMLKVQEDMVTFRTDTTTFADFDSHSATHHIARGQVLGTWRIAFHECFALRIAENATFTTCTFSDQATRTVDTSRMELHELHILHRQAGTQYHAATITCTGMCRSTGEIGSTITTGGQHNHMGTETMNRSCRHVDCNHATAFAIFHDQINSKILNEELSFMLECLLIESVQHGMAGTISRRTGTLCSRACSVLSSHAAERALVNLAFFSTRKRQAVMLQFQNCRRGFFTHEFDGVLVTQPVGTLDGVIHVPAPVILPHIAKRSRNSTLCGNRMATGRKYLGHTGN